MKVVQVSKKLKLGSLQFGKFVLPMFLLCVLFSYERDSLCVCVCVCVCGTSNYWSRRVIEFVLLVPLLSSTYSSTRLGERMFIAELLNMLI